MPSGEKGQGGCAEADSVGVPRWQAVPAGVRSHYASPNGVGVSPAALAVSHLNSTGGLSQRPLRLPAFG